MIEQQAETAKIDPYQDNTSQDLIEEIIDPFHPPKDTFTQAREAFDKHLGFFGRDMTHDLIQRDPIVKKIYECGVRAIQEEIEKKN